MMDKAMMRPIAIPMSVPAATPRKSIFCSPFVVSLSKAARILLHLRQGSKPEGPRRGKRSSVAERDEISLPGATRNVAQGARRAQAQMHVRPGIQRTCCTAKRATALASTASATIQFQGLERTSKSEATSTVTTARKTVWRSQPTPP